MSKREKKSIRRLKNALMELLAEKPFPEIHTMEIVERADVGRSTFYHYYRDKAHLLEEIEDELTEGYLEVLRGVRQQGYVPYSQEPAPGEYPSLLRYFDYFRAHYDAFHILFSESGQTGYREKFRQDIMAHELQRQFIPREMPDEFYQSLVRLGVNYFTDVFCMWIASDMTMPVHALATMLQQMLQTQSQLTDTAKTLMHPEGKA